MKLKVLDLFCGAAGGWSLGLHRAGGFETVAACEIDPWRRSAFSRNFPDAEMYGDVQGLSAVQLAIDGIEPPDVIVGSPPCQDASVANHGGKGVDGVRTGLFFEAIRLVGELRPRWACFENVPGLRLRGIDRVIEGLEAHGYTVWCCVVGADDVGANHRRKRVWVIARLDPDATGDRRRSGWPGRPDPGAAGEQGELRARGSAVADAANPDGAALRNEPGRGCRASGARAPLAQLGCPGAHADGQGRHAGACDAEAMGRRAGAAILARGHAADADAAGLAIGEGLCGDHGQELATVERDDPFPWAHWNGGPPRDHRVDDGLPAGLDLASVQAAYGDAVVPVIPELIGRFILMMEGIET